jgi:hypothetical protein
MKRYLILTLFVMIAGCETTKPMVRMEEGRSLAKYRTVNVLPVMNKTGETFELDVTAELTHYLKSRFRDKGYMIVEGSEAQGSTLVVKSSILAYKPGSASKRWLFPGAGATQLTVKTLLIDEKTGETIGEMVTAESVAGGGLFSVGADKSILKVVAKAIVDYIDKRAKEQ